MKSPDTEDITRRFYRTVVEEFTEIIVHYLLQKADDMRTLLNNIVRLVLLDSKARDKWGGG